MSNFGINNFKGTLNSFAKFNVSKATTNTVNSLFNAADGLDIGNNSGQITQIPQAKDGMLSIYELSLVAADVQKSTTPGDKTATSVFLTKMIDNFDIATSGDGLSQADATKLFQLANNYSLIDADGNGKLEGDEREAAKLILNSTQAQLDQIKGMVKSFGDGNTTLSSAEAKMFEGIDGKEGISQDDINTMKKLSDNVGKFDLNGDGKLDASEVNSAKPLAKLTQAQLNDLGSVAKLFGDGKGTIDSTKADLIGSFDGKEGISQADIDFAKKLNTNVSKFDVDGDGKFNDAELSTAQSLTKNLTQDQLNDLGSVAKAFGDGKGTIDATKADLIGSFDGQAGISQADIAFAEKLNTNLGKFDVDNDGKFSGSELATAQSLSKNLTQAQLNDLGSVAKAFGDGKGTIDATKADLIGNLDGTTGISQADIDFAKKLNTNLGKFDVNGDGKFSDTELGTAKAIAKNLTQAQLNDLSTVAKSFGNGDSVIDADEAALIGSFNGSNDGINQADIDEAKRRTTNLEAFDANGDNKFDADELKTFDSVKNLTQAQLNQLKNVAGTYSDKDVITDAVINTVKGLDGDSSSLSAADLAKATKQSAVFKNNTADNLEAFIGIGKGKGFVTAEDIDAYKVKNNSKLTAADKDLLDMMSLVAGKNGGKVTSDLLNTLAGADKTLEITDITSMFTNPDNLGKYITSKEDFDAFYPLITKAGYATADLKAAFVALKPIFDDPEQLKLLMEAKNDVAGDKDLNDTTLSAGDWKALTELSGFSGKTLQAADVKDLATAIARYQDTVGANGNGPEANTFRGKLSDLKEYNS